MAGHGPLTFRQGIAVAQVLFFTAAISAAYYFRRTKRIGWLTLGILAIFRLVGASCLLVTVNHDSHSAWSGVFVCESLGVLVLNFLLLELLERINSVTPTVRPFVFIIPQILTLVDIGISIGGFVAVTNKDHDQLLPTPWSRAGVALLFTIYLYVVGTFVKFATKRASYHDDERRLLFCVAICVPLLGVRAAYPLVWAIVSSLTWSPVKGSPTIYFIMSMLPEVLMITASIVSIVQVKPVPHKGKEGG